MTEQRIHYALTFGVPGIVAMALRSVPVPDPSRAGHPRAGPARLVVDGDVAAHRLSPRGTLVATPIVGRLGDMYGKEKMLAGVLAALTLGTVVSGLATSVSVMIVGQGRHRNRPPLGHPRHRYRRRRRDRPLRSDRRALDHHLAVLGPNLGLREVTADAPPGDLPVPGHIVRTAAGPRGGSG